MKTVKRLNFICILALVTILANCSMNNDAKITKLPEIINQETGLREIRMRRYDCLHLAVEQDPQGCTHNEQIISETIKSKETPSAIQSSQGASTSSVTENLRINELTPWLDNRARTVVNTTVMYNDLKEEVYVITYLRKFDKDSKGFKDFKHELKADLKSYKREYHSTHQRKYLNFQRAKAESNDVVNAIAHCYDIPTCKDITLIISFRNFDSQGNSFVDSRPFMIDQRETEIRKEDGNPTTAQRTLVEPQLIEEGEDEDEDNIHTEEYTPDEDEVIIQAPARPLLRSENIEALCDGLISNSENCPKYLTDPTLERPEPASSVSDIKLKEGSNSAVVKDETQQVRIQKITEQNENSQKVTIQKIKPSAGLTTSKRPLPRPDGLGKYQDVTDEFVDVVDEKVFPKEEVVLQPETPREPEENADLLPPPNTKSYKTQTYRQFFERLVQLKNSAVETVGTMAEHIQNNIEKQQIANSNTNIGTQRPKPRPEGLGTKINEEISNNDVTTISEDNKKENSQVDVEKEQRPMSRSDAIEPFQSIDGKFTYDLSLCVEHLIKAKNINYNQARGYYSNGSLTKATLYTSSKYETIFHKPNNAIKQHSSEITKQVMEFAGCVLKQRYGERLQNQINNLSREKGGRIGGQGSHQNGLDADVSYPHINERTSGFDNFAGNISEDRLIAAFDQARLLIYTDRVEMLFTDDKIRTRFCQYLKNSKKLSNYRNVVERYMRHWKGHHHHYHVRVKCTVQNEGCVPQNFTKTNFCEKK